MRCSFRALFTLALCALLTTPQSAWCKDIFTAADAEHIGAQLAYEYRPESLYQVDTQVGYVTDITLHPGETVTHIAGGDTVRWLVDQATVGGIHHVYVKPIAAEIESNMIITTNDRSYRLLLRSTDVYNPIVSWYFLGAKLPPDPGLENQVSNNEELTVYTPDADGESVVFDGRKVLSFGYKIKRLKHCDDAFIPLAIFDDGIHTYIRMPKSNQYDLPVLYSVDDIEDNKLTLINYRVIAGLFVADRCFSHGRLQFSQKRSLDFVPSARK